MSDIRPSFLALFVRDLQTSARFYAEAVGLPLHRGADNEAPDDPWLAGEHASVSFRDGGYFHFALFERAPGSETVRAQLGFSVGDIESAHARMSAAGARMLHPPRNEAWGTTARYEDPDGNCVSLTQPLRR